MSISTWISRVGPCLQGAALLLVGANASLAAQAHPVGALPTTPGLTYKMYDARSFYTFDSTTQFATDSLNGGRYLTGGYTGLGISLDLPAGAAVEEMTWYFMVNDGAGSLIFSFYSVDLDSSDWVDLGDLSTTGVSPDIRSISLTGAPLTTIDNSHFLYRVSVWFWGANTAYQLYGMRVGYRLQVSPAPAAASFLDVPTTDPFFQYVEALKASGITGGCGDGTNFCPNQPVLRKQMAVFLAKALGLNWP